jgi:hypothetical protein
MVSEKKVEDKTVFLCDICGLGYADRKTAQECEDYCRTHHGSAVLKLARKLFTFQVHQCCQRKNSY